ncbi:EAL domain-containing protein [Shewanella pneumatophori]|uniref:EAL domain-containing protein n=1 Tax=Shewanella pneumatophori TaxID=314092 RepID=A0A9X1ZDP5_9GAMM|nr:EAL domain-containing protein [Shewanella pneumatophori]MCL1137455.1 EAL domain-containing protein [Shewanella pneumatophori]
MPTSKLFQLLLLLIFSALTVLSFQQEKQNLDKQNKNLLKSYVAEISKQEQWQGKGAELYALMKPEVDFQFFQYIDATDSNNNYTRGTLQATAPSLLASVFSSNIAETHVLAAGRLQVKLSNQPLLIQASNHFQQQLIIIWGSFLLISLSYAWLTRRQKSNLSYIANKIEDLANLSFDAIKLSRLKSDYRVIATSLEKSQQTLKLKINQLQEDNDKLSKTAFQDPVTGFGTRARFTEKLDEICKPNQDEVGNLFIIKATELGTINQMVGREGGDDYLSRIANELRTAFKDCSQALFYRISTADFAVVLPNINLKQSTQIASQIKTGFNEYQQQVGTASIAHIGLVPYSQDTDAVSLMTLADTAVSIAQTLGPNSYHVQEKLTGDELFGESRWKVAISDLIRRKAVKFYVQPIRPCRNDVESYRELLSRFYNNEGKLFPTTTVIAMAERHGMSEEIDKLIVLNAIQILLQSPSISGLIGINISAASATKKPFVTWLKNMLIQQRHIAARLVFEVNESGMQSNLSATYHFINELHSVGSRVSIERFGLGFTSFKFFKEVRPDFIKLDHSYTQGISSDPQNRFFVKMIIDIARKLAIRVIATGVENQEDKLIMEQMLIDGLQGFYIAKPTALLLDDKAKNSA